MSDSVFLTDGNGTITGLVDTAYAGELIIPEYVAGERITGIGNTAFFRCYSLISVVIPNSVTSIGENAFAECDSLISVVIPDGVTSIGNGAFLRCTSLTFVVIPNSVTSIGDSAFGRCTSLTSIIIPDSVTSIGNTAFFYCINLTSVVIPDGVISIGESAFGQCYSLASIAIPDSVTSIDDTAFIRCTSLTTVYVDDPNNLSSAVSSYLWTATTGSPSVTFVSVDELYRISRLVINKLTLDQYKTAKSEGKVAEDEVYVVTDIDEAIGSIPTPDVSGQINTHNTDTTAHSDIRTAASNAASAASAAQSAADGKVSKSGDTMTGALTLSGDPYEDNHAATKKYVDDGLGNKADADDALVKYVGGALTTSGGAAVQAGTSMVKVWENADLSSEFLAQTVPLDMTQYDAIMIVSQGCNTANQTTYENQNSPIIPKDGKAYIVTTGGISTGFSHRQVSVTDAGVTFTRALYRSNAAFGSNNGSNNGTIPQVIYGIKGVF